MRKVKYLVAALLLMGATTTFTSCIDNDEPAGITELRGAKAELLKAKAAVELANAAYVDAQTQYQLAKVEEQNLLNEYWKLKNQLKELEVKEETAETEATIAWINAQLEINKLDWERVRLEYATTLANAQKEYEDAMKALELSKDYLSDNERAVVTEVMGIVNAARTEMETAQANLNGAYDQLQEAMEDPQNFLTKEELEAKLAEAQADLETKTNRLNILKETLEAIKSDDAYQAWLDLKSDYEGRLDSLKLVQADKETKKAEIIAANASGVIKDLQDAVADILDDTKVKPETASGQDSTYTVSSALIEDLKDAKITGDFLSYDATTGKITAKFKSGGNIMDLRDATALKKEEANATNENNYKDYEKLLDNKYVFADQDGSGYKKAVTNIDNAVKAVTDAKNAVNPNELAYAKDDQEAAKKAMDNQKKIADDAIAEWEDAVEALNEGAETYTKTEFDLAMTGMEAKLNMRGKADDDLMKAIHTEYLNFVALMKANGQDVSKVDGKYAKLEDFKAASTDILLDIAFNSITPEEKLLEAAKAAFGVAGVYNDGVNGDRGVLVKPSDDELKTNKNGLDKCGAQGLYLKCVAAYDEATDVVEKLTRFAEVIAQLNSYKTSLATLKTAYVAKYQKYIDAVVDAQAAVKEKVSTPIAALKLDVIDQEIEDIQRILADVSGVKEEDYESPNADLANFDELIGYLETQIGDENEGLIKDVADAQDEVTKAENNIALFEAGNLKEQHVIEYAQEKVDRMKAAYERSVEIFNYWNDKLESLMDKLYKGEDVTIPDETPEETPAE